MQSSPSDHELTESTCQNRRMNGSEAEQLVVVVVIADAKGNDNSRKPVMFVTSMVLRRAVNDTVISRTATLAFKRDTKTTARYHQSTRQSTPPSSQAYHAPASQAVSQML